MSRLPFEGYVVIPAFNEAEGIGSFLAGLCGYLGTDPLLSDGSFRWTILVVNDGSSDQTEDCLATAVSGQSKGSVQIAFVSLIRNFGHQSALLAGLRAAATRRADFVITLDADGEHPTRIFPELVAHWRKGASIVHTSRLPDERLSRFKAISSRMYYFLLRNLGNIEISAGMADYKLWDGDLLRSIRPFLNTCGSTRAFASWLVPAAPVVTYKQDVMEGRVSRFTTRKMLSLALSGLVRYSEFPIRLAFYVGVGALIVAVLLFTHAVVAYFLGMTLPGWTSIVALVILFGGIQCFLLGVYGEYFLRNLFRANLPTFVIKPPRDERLSRSNESSRDAETTRQTTSRELTSKL